MYIINVIPLIKIPFPNPQILSYFFTKKLPRGALVKILIRKKQINAIVISSENLEKTKIHIKKTASFKLKPIEKVISFQPVLFKNQLKLLFWIANYYFAPVGIIAKIFLSAVQKFKKSGSGFPLSELKNLILTPKTKSLIFAPFKNLKSIIVEDADNQQYQSWGRRPHYNVKDIAIQSAKIYKAKLILKSRLPSIETYYWGEKNRYKLKIQKSKVKTTIQNLKIIDLREEIRRGNYSIISRELQGELLKSSKSILFISRRGSATFILCRDCGYVIKCQNCEVPMVLHEVGAKLICHHCGEEKKAPTLCPNCKGYRIKYSGAGTQKVESEVKKLFPKTNIFRLDSDTAKKPIEQQEIIKKFNQEKSAILVGAQMLLNKTIKANLVAVVSIETILNLPDYRSQERVFLILKQLQSMSKTKFLIQTYNPENLAIKSAVENSTLVGTAGWQNFYNEEIKFRKALNYPPFSQIIKLTFEHQNPKKAEDETRILFEKLKIQITNFQFPATNFQLLGPVPAFIPKIAGKYRWQIIIKSKIKNLKQRNKLLTIVPPTWNIEVDPESLL